RNVEAGMYSIYSKNRRALPIGVAAAQGYTETTETEITWNSVLEAEITLAESSGLGFTVDFDPETAAETFRVYRGADRSLESTDNYVGYFGTDAANINDVQITSGTTDFKNVAIVAGAGEGTARVVRTVSLGNFTGEARRELYVDARDLQPEYQQATPTGEYDDKGNPVFTYETKTYTEAEYNAILDARGHEKMAEHLQDFGIACDIDQNNIMYGKDYFLGDRMPIKLPTYGIFASAVIASVRTEYENSGKRIIATLNNFRLEEAYG
ncbi:siphovirus ReqiPepy6 Gp37-like family protein, partial [Clostridia bacterium OttesenSCG-928-O13]|nr:siphovirus ReqiPepy6 Gp37-like family protein [Clostridia bacterium OttesenSCG-928-O13]